MASTSGAHAEAAREFGPIAASLRAAGQKPRARAFDAMIAAIALSRDLPIYTFNPRDFAATGADLVDLGEEAERPPPDPRRHPDSVVQAPPPSVLRPG